MAYDGRLLRQAKERFDADKALREARYQQKQERVYRAIPRIAEIDRELQGTMSRIIASALRRGTDPGPAIRVLRDENLSLQREKVECLVSHGYEENYLDNEPVCSLCGDSGYRGGSVCRCLQEYYAREQIKELSRMLDLGTQSFDTFSFEYYDERIWPEWGISPRENMELCASYAHNFSPRSGNLLLHGKAGLGKTFLSACIAREVSEKGFSVVYDTAASIFSQFEDRKFNRDDPDAGEVERVLKCDLLIIDDLGTEMTTGFVQSALYQIVNTRLVGGRQTIISTNLSPDEIGRRYMRQIQSRIEGEYRVLPFFGEDIRLQKRK